MPSVFGRHRQAYIFILKTLNYSFLSIIFGYLEFDKSPIYRKGVYKSINLNILYIFFFFLL